MKGNGVHRILKPIEGEDVNFWDLIISRADFCYKKFFGFFGLPAGDYNLFIKAKGYKPIKKKIFCHTWNTKRFQGDCWDNAPTERVIGSIKSERLSDCRFTTRRFAQLEVLDYIEYYNSIRLHSTLGYKSPMAYEKELQRKAA